MNKVIVNDEKIEGSTTYVLSRIQIELANYILKLDTRDLESAISKLEETAEILRLLEDYLNEDYVLLEKTPMGSWVFKNCTRWANKAKVLIDDFCEREYGRGADFSNLSKIDIAYTTTEDDKEIQVSVDLVDFSIDTWVNNELYDLAAYNTMQELIEVLKYLDFDELVRL